MEVHKTEEVNAEEIQVTVTDVPVKEYPFTDDQKDFLKEQFNNIRANYTTIEELSRKNREYFEGMHKYIREIHPELVDVDYAINPTTLHIQLRKPQ